MLTNMVIYVTSGNLCAQQNLISWLFFNAVSQLYHTEFDFLWLFIHLCPRKNVFKYPAFFKSFKGNIIWTCALGPVMSPSVVFIWFAKKVTIQCSFLLIFSQLLRILFSLKLWNKKWGSLCSFKRKGAFILLSSLVWRKSLTLCTHTHSCACANDTKVVCSRDAQSNTKELPLVNR